jgi:hypothetical protein
MMPAPEHHKVVGTFFSTRSYGGDYEKCRDVNNILLAARAERGERGDRLVTALIPCEDLCAGICPGLEELAGDRDRW